MFELLPQTIIAALITGLAAFGGVSYSLRRHAERARADAELDMRREIYLAASESMAKTMEYLIGMGNPSIPDDQHDAFVQDFSTKTSKIHLIGNQRTISSLETFYEVFVSCIAPLSPMRVEMMNRKKALDRTRDLKIEVEREFLKQVLTGVQLSANQKAVDKIDAEISAAAKDLDIARKEIMLKAIESAVRLTPYSVEVVLAARAEMGFRLDEESYKELITSVNSRVATLCKANF